MNTVPNDTRHFVSGVVEYLRKEGKTPTVLPKVRALFQKITRRARTERQALVESSVPLTTAEREKLSEILGNFLGHPVSLQLKVKKDLLGGLRIQVADWIVDTSFAQSLECMKKQLQL